MPLVPVRPGVGEGAWDPFPPRANGRPRTQMEPSRRGNANACRVVATPPPPPPAAPARRHRTLAMRWLICDAWCAAPYPLSMFTTDTPEAHEFSIASKAAMPPNEAP